MLASPSIRGECLAPHFVSSYICGEQCCGISGLTHAASGCRHGDEQKLCSLMGVMQGIFSFVTSGGDDLRYERGVTTRGA
jgi:hypothetical protein